MKSLIAVLVMSAFFTTAGESRAEVQRITVPEFLDDRPVWVYLPPGYDEETERRYPVLYMMDGQTVFVDTTNPEGGWKVDESLDELIPTGRVAPLIVVAVANGGDNRTREYTPWYSANLKTGGGGKKHLETWIKVLLPFINTNFRTRTGPANTGLAGSSFGGLMALYAAYTYPHVFGNFGSFSPTTRWAGGRVRDMVSRMVKPNIIIYMDMGTMESGAFQDKDMNGVADPIDSLRFMLGIFTAQGFVEGEDLLIIEGVGHEHNEFYWSQRFSGAVQFLFPGPPVE